MLVRYELDPNDDVNMDFDDLLKKIMGLLMEKKKLPNLVHIEKESQGVEDLVMRDDYKSCISSNSSSFITPPSIPVYYPPHFLSPPSIQTSGTYYRPIHNKIAHLTEKIIFLVMSV